MNKIIQTKFLSRSEAIKISSSFKNGIVLFGVDGVPYDKKVAIVSMVSPREAFEPIDADDVPLDGYWHKVLKLQFQDVDPSHCSPEWIAGKKPMTMDHANKILDFLLEVQDEVDEIWTHCEAGISRSAAVAKFIAGTYNGYFPESYSLYNKYVYSTLRKAQAGRIYSGQSAPGFFNELHNKKPN